MMSRDRGDGCATGQPQGVGSEAYLNGTSQQATREISGLRSSWPMSTRLQFYRSG
ncbi:MAG: hypothetical protein WBH05_07765 [Syntrophobacteria bacterium]